MQPRTVAALGLVALLLGAAPFVARPTVPQQPAVPFDETKAIGISGRVVNRAQETSLVIPRAEAYYARYRYVVGYYGITSLVSTVRTGRRRELGRLMTVYVSDFSGTQVRVGEEGYLRIPTVRTPGWVSAANAYFVVNSSARLPTRTTAIVPFSDRGDALAFARNYGGHVERWATVRRRSLGRAGRTIRAWQRVVRRRNARADRTVATSRSLLDRPVSIVVGQGAPTIAAAIRQAPPNTTVVVPPGTYRVRDLRIDKPLTLRGAGPNATRIVGDRIGSVVTVTAPRTAITDVFITGVGTDRSGSGDRVENVSVPKTSFKYTYYKVHGYGAAAIVFDSAGRSLVADVRIDTTSNGIVARTSPNVVITNLTLYGTEHWEDGFLGVATLGARIVVQNSTFYGGKVGVYAYDAPHVVVRNTRMEGMMVGVFDLFSPQIHVANNAIEDVWNAIYLETRSYGNTIVGNRVHNSWNGIVVEGRSNFVARNVVLHNRHGIQVHGHYSVYWRNVLASNRVGALSESLLPTNRVTANDFVGNRRYVKTQHWNVLHIWPENYWRGAPGLDTDGDPYLERSFRPTGPVDGLVATAPGAPTLARSPALVFLRQLQQLVPGLRSAGVIDPRPLATPVHPRLLARLRSRYTTAGQHQDPDSWEYTP